MATMVMRTCLSVTFKRVLTIFFLLWTFEWPIVSYLKDLVF